MGDKKFLLLTKMSNTLILEKGARSICILIVDMSLVLFSQPVILDTHKETYECNRLLL